MGGPGRGARLARILARVGLYSLPAITGWERMRSDAPRNTPELEQFSRALEEAYAAVDALPDRFSAAVSALLRLEDRFEALARSLDLHT